MVAALLSVSELAVLQDNTDLENILSEFKMPTMQRATLRVAGFGEIVSTV